MNTDTRLADDFDGESIIEAFYAAVNLRRFDEGEQLLARLAARAACGDWCTYLSGVLASQRDNDFAAAERLYRAALSSPAASPLLRARIRVALALAAWRQGRWSAAIESARSSLAIFQDLGRSVDQAVALRYMAISYRRAFETGEFGPERLEEAVSTCQQALAILADGHEDTPRGQQIQAVTWNSLGLLYRTLGRWAEAVLCFERYLAAGQARGDPETIGYAHGNLGTIYTLMGPAHWPQALESLGRALAQIRAGDDPLEEIEALANLAHIHALMGQLDAGLASYLQALDLIDQVRAAVTSDDARAGFFATVADTFANAVALAVDLGRDALAFELAERARARAFLDILAAGSAELPRESQAAPLTLSQVQAALPDGAVLISYFTMGQIDPSARGLVGGPPAWRHRFPPARTMGFVVTRERLQIFDARISPNDLAPRRLVSAPEHHFLEPQARRVLYERLIGPASSSLRGVNRLYIAPHGPLHSLPFAALLAADGEPLLGGAVSEIVYGYSASSLLRPKAGADQSPARRCLALGYNGPEPVLRFAEEEAQSVAALLGGEAMAGAEPKKEYLRENAAEYELLHFSCHGEFDPAAPLQSALHLAPGETLSAAEVLTDLRLRCRLVVLSACESGRSRVRRGDELSGLIRAFIAAGASALIGTLWPVDERSTWLLMAHFYGELASGAHPAAALARAQHYLRRLDRAEVEALLGPLSPPVAAQPFADPFYWAPFILVGDSALV